ncbi:MAG: redoxin domain-containing protein [Pseudomonadota bacterium]
MMRAKIGTVAGMTAAVVFTAGSLIAFTANAQSPVINGAAPAFTGLTASGETISLSDFEGQRVILEWTNHDCPFVVKHYDGELANMQSMQASSADADTVWISVISSAEGKQGHVSPAKALELSETRNASPAHIVLDESGEIGRLYEAKTTPHMFIIEPDGALAYDGAIDSIPSARVSDIPKAINYVSTGVSTLDAGGAPDPASTKPYGCSVKY